jgi:hypothetical protein
VPAFPRIATMVEVQRAWGIPVLNIRCAWRENEIALRNDMSVAGAEMLEAAGARDIEPAFMITHAAFQFVKWVQLGRVVTQRPLY